MSDDPRRSSLLCSVGPLADLDGGDEQMSILLKDMEMPQGNSTINVLIYADGTVYTGHVNDSRYSAVSVPAPHGRLIDADALHDAMYHRAFETDGDTMWQSGCCVRYRAIEQVHESQPTIIEAEGSEE